MARKFLSTTTGECLHACFGESTGIIQGGKLSGDTIIEMNEKAYVGDEKSINVAKVIGSECGAVSDANRCEMAKLSGCFREVLFFLFC